MESVQIFISQYIDRMEIYMEYVNTNVAILQAEFLKKIRCLRCEEYLRRYFLYNASPIIQKVKPSVLLNMKRECKTKWQEIASELCHYTGLCSYELNYLEDNVLILLYDQTELAKVFQSEIAQSILYHYGYSSSWSLKDKLLYLEKRFEAADDFPHEVGVFLGYPPMDVKAYIENNGQNQCGTYYWKVYHDEENAREAFQKIDDAKIKAINILTRQVTWLQAANLLKQPQAVTHA